MDADPGRRDDLIPSTVKSQTYALGRSPDPEGQHPVWPGLHDARAVRLADFQFRPDEWFLYEYDFGDGWQHVVRVERRLPLEPRRTYPVCVGGQRAAPPEDCGGPGAFLGRRDAVPGQVREHLERILAGVEAGDREAVGDELEAVESLREWLALDRFDRRAVNCRLRLYAEGDARWRAES
jgi:hypothetical protein